MEIVPKTPMPVSLAAEKSSQNRRNYGVTCFGGAVSSPWPNEPVVWVVVCTSVQFFTCVSKLSPERVKAHSAYSCLLKPAKNAPLWLAIPLQTYSSIPNLFCFISALVPKLEVSFPCQVLQSCSLAPLSHWVISYHFERTASTWSYGQLFSYCMFPARSDYWTCMHAFAAFTSEPCTMWMSLQRARTANFKDPCAWKWVTPLIFFWFSSIDICFFCLFENIGLP